MMARDLKISTTKGLVQRWITITSFMGMSAFSVDPNYMVFYWLNMVILNVISIVHFMLVIQTVIETYQDDLVTSVLAIHFNLIILLGHLLSGVTNWKRMKLILLMELSKRPLHNYTDTYETEKSLYASFSEIFDSLTVFLPAIILVIMTIFPFLAGIYPEQALEIPSEGVNSRLLFSMYYPFKCDEGLRFVVASILQGYNLFCLFCASITSVLLNGRIVRGLLEEMEILKSSLKHFDMRVQKMYHSEARARRASSNYVHPNDWLLNKCARSCLQENINHHYSITKYFWNYSDVCSACVLGSFTICSMGIAVLMTALTGNKNGDGQLQGSTTFLILFYMTSEIIFMGYICWSGEQVINLCSEIHQEVQFLRLDKYNVAFMKDVILFLVGTKKEFVCMSGGYLANDFNTYRSMLNSAYSFFNLMKASK